MGEKYVVFQIGEGNYSIPLEEVFQIIRYENVTGVPTAPPFVDGVINIGGDVSGNIVIGNNNKVEYRKKE